jgi:hypothetical protein
MNMKLLFQLRKLFNKFDLVGIYISEKINFDQYDPEIKLIVERFKICRDVNEFTIEVCSVFESMFWNGIFDSKLKYKYLAEETYSLLQKELKTAN